MSSFRSLSSIWKNIKEFELRPIEEDACREVRLALVGAMGSGRHTLAAGLRTDPRRPSMHLPSPLIIADLESPEAASRAHLIILVLDATRTDFTTEAALAKKWTNAGKPVIAFWNKADLLEAGSGIPSWDDLEVAGSVAGSALDSQFLLKSFAPLVLRLLPDLSLALGRSFPLFRFPIAHQLINDTCLANAAYAFSTGLAEVVPILDLPLNITDMAVLTKAQAFLVYRLGLLLGFSTRWQDYIAEFGSVIGGGFLWRQLARSLVGLIPVWGILPKVAVAYAGTYVVGHAILQWYLTGRHIDRKQLNALYRQALAHGRANAQRLIKSLPKPRLGRKKKAELPPKSASEPERLAAETLTGNELSTPPKACPDCGKSNAADAVFCQYCGKKLND